MLCVFVDLYYICKGEHRVGIISLIKPMKCQEEHYMTNKLWRNYVCTFRCNATGGWINFSGNIFTFLPLFLMNGKSLGWIVYHMRLSLAKNGTLVEVMEKLFLGLNINKHILHITLDFFCINPYHSFSASFYDSQSFREKNCFSLYTKRAATFAVIFVSFWNTFSSHNTSLVTPSKSLCN